MTKPQAKSTDPGVRPHRIGVRADRAGFSLVELILVMTVMGLLLSIVMPRIDISRFQVDAGVQEVASTVAALRGQAIVRQHDFVLTFDVPQGRYTVLYDANNNGEADEGEQSRIVELPENVTFALGGADALGGMTDAISFTREVESLPALTFHRNGAASEEGGLYITSMRAANSSTNAQDTRVVKVERSTGRVRCFSYRTQAWAEGC